MSTIQVFGPVKDFLDTISDAEKAAECLSVAIFQPTMSSEAHYGPLVPGRPKDSLEPIDYFRKFSPQVKDLTITDCVQKEYSDDIRTHTVVFDLDMLGGRVSVTQFFVTEGDEIKLLHSSLSENMVSDITVASVDFSDKTVSVGTKDGIRVSILDEVICFASKIPVKRG